MMTTNANIGLDQSVLQLFGFCDLFVFYESLQFAAFIAQHVRKRAHSTDAPCMATLQRGSEARVSQDLTNAQSWIQEACRSCQHLKVFAFGLVYNQSKL